MGICSLTSCKCTTYFRPHYKLCPRYVHITAAVAPKSTSWNGDKVLIYAPKWWKMSQLYGFKKYFQNFINELKVISLNSCVFRLKRSQAIFRKTRLRDVSVLNKILNLLFRSCPKFKHLVCPNVGKTVKCTLFFFLRTYRTIFWGSPACADACELFVKSLVWDKADVCNYWLYILHDTGSVQTACVGQPYRSIHAYSSNCVRPVVCKTSLLDTQTMMEFDNKRFLPLTRGLGCVYLCVYAFKKEATGPVMSCV